MFSRIFIGILATFFLLILCLSATEGQDYSPGKQQYFVFEPQDTENVGQDVSAQIRLISALEDLTQLFRQVLVKLQRFSHWCRRHQNFDADGKIFDVNF